ncbi:hypothetical protein BG000_011896 [Podila horticola]|nr:hypothetical protein BG000_011896 [Podila horticola]
MLRNTVTDNILTLFCLVDGEAASNAFSVEIDPIKTVDGLKKLIKTEKAPRFDDVAADELTIWRVSIPINDDEVRILLNNVTIKDMKKLGPATRLSKVFPEELPEETTHYAFRIITFVNKMEMAGRRGTLGKFFRGHH